MSFDFETLAVHAGVSPDPLTGAVMTPIYQTSTYAQASPGEHKGYEYSRTDNPTRTALQASLAALEGGEHALVFSSGLAATDAVLNLLDAGDHVLAGEDLYGGTYRLFSQVASKRGIEFAFISLNDCQTLKDRLKRNTRLLWFETPTNPMLNLIDIAATTKIAREHGILSVVDNTFMSPALQRPLDLGADIAMHSMTKFLNGHSDVVMGSLIMRSKETYERLKYLQNAIGAVPSPFDCFLVLRGLKTLALRMERHTGNATKLAQWLETHPKIHRVIYPGLTSDPYHALAKSQMSGFGGMLTVLVDGDLDQTKRFLSSLKVCTLAESLGGVETLIEHPAIMTHASVPAEIRQKIGIHDNLVRLSVGIESVKDLMEDIDQALASV